MCSDFAEHESSESIKTEVHSPGCSGRNISRIEAYGLMKSLAISISCALPRGCCCSYKETKAALLPECRISVLNF